MRLGLTKFFSEMKLTWFNYGSYLWSGDVLGRHQCGVLAAWSAGLPSLASMETDRSQVKSASQQQVVNGLSSDFVMPRRCCAHADRSVCKWKEEILAAVRDFYTGLDGVLQEQKMLAFLGKIRGAAVDGASAMPKVAGLLRSHCPAMAFHFRDRAHAVRSQV